MANKEQIELIMMKKQEKRIIGEMLDKYLNDDDHEDIMGGSNMGNNKGALDIIEMEGTSDIKMDE